MFSASCINTFEVGSMDHYRILSLDGGGIWALIQIKTLIELYGPDKAGREVLQDFNLVSANSGGSIVLGCLIENFSLRESLALFNDESLRRSIFSRTDSLGDRLLNDFIKFGPKYSEKNKLITFQRVFAERGSSFLPEAVAGIRRVGASEDLHILITSFDYDHDRATFFRSAPVTGPEWGHGNASSITLAEAIHASTNAPVSYFDAPATFPDRKGRYWDGGVSGCNNPVLVAVTEAIVKGQSPANIVALSLGTGSVALPLPQPGEKLSPPFVRKIVEPGIKYDIQKLAGSILDDPPDIATFLAHVMTRNGVGLGTQVSDSRIVRMSPLISPVKKRMNDEDIWSTPGNMTEAEFENLASLDFDVVEQTQVDAITSYADLWIKDEAPNHPIRMNGATLVCELGQDRFSTAKAAWEAIK
jgi:uncharacterized protein